MKDKPMPIWRAVLSGGCVVEGYKFGNKCPKWIAQNNDNMMKKPVKNT